MKVAVWHNLPSGGGKRQLHGHVKGLVARGHTVECWSPDTADRDFLPLSEFAAEHVVPLDRGDRMSPRTGIRSAWQHLRNQMRDLERLERHCRACATAMERGGFDVLFANATQGFHVSPIARCTALPCAMYLGEPYRWLYEARPDWPWNALPTPTRSFWSPGYLRWFVEDAVQLQAKRLKAREETRNARACGTLLVNSLFTREAVLRIYGCGAKVCYLGVDSDLFKPGPESRTNTVVGVGVIRRRKGVESAIRAVASIAAGIRPELVWVGNVSDARYEKRMAALAASLGVRFSPRVRVSDQELVEILGAALAMVYAPRLEPFGLAPLEANACETPVVAVAEGGVRETIRDGINGILVRDDEPEALGEAITSLVEDPGRARSMGKNARQLVLEEWGWLAAIDRLEAYLGALVSAGKSGPQS